MPDERIPKVLQYKELTTGKRTRGRPHPSLKNVCKRDMWTMYIEVWEDVSKDHSDRRFNFHRGLERGEEKRWFSAGEKRPRLKWDMATSGEIIFTCVCCNGDYHFDVVRLYIHNRCCTAIRNWGICLWAQIQGLSKPMDATYLHVYLECLKHIISVK